MNEYTDMVRRKKSEKGDTSRINILDLGCGKGGDLLKWQKARVNHYVGADIAQTSVEQASDRYNKMKRGYKRTKHGRNLGRKTISLKYFLSRQSSSFSAEFIAADCTKVRLKERYRDPDLQFDVVSCQFAFHYCFESLPQVTNYLQHSN